MWFESGYTMKYSLSPLAQDIFHCISLLSWQYRFSINAIEQYVYLLIHWKHRSSFIRPCKSEFHTLFFLLISLAFDMLAVVYKLSRKILPIGFHWDLLGVSRPNSDNLVNFDKHILPKICVFWLKFEFQLSKFLVLELTGKHVSSLEHIYWQHMCILPSLHFSGQRFIYLLQCISVTSKMFSWSPNLKIYLKKHYSSFCPF